MDYRQYSSLEIIKLSGGTTVDEESVILALGLHQTLHLRNITDGDTDSSSVFDGGIILDRYPGEQLTIELEGVGASRFQEKTALNIDLLPENTRLNLKVGGTIRLICTIAA